MGCSPSKTQASSPVAAQAAGNNARRPEGTSLLTEAAAEVKSLQMDIPVVKVLIHSARGLRSTAAAAPDDGGAPPAAKEVVVTVEIEGKAGSKVTTPKIVAEAEAQEGSGLKTVRVAFPEAEFEIKAFVTGDSLLFTVQDALTNEIFGKAILTEDQVKGNFEGEFPLADAGEGYQAFLKVTLGSRHIAVATAEKIVEEVKEAIEEIKEVLGNMEGLAEKITDVKAAVNEAVQDIKEDIEDAVQEVEETNGAVCCSC